MIIVTNIRNKKSSRKSEAIKFLSGNFHNVFINCEFTLPILGGYFTPLKRGDIVVYWLDSRIHYHGDRMPLYISNIPDKKHKYMNIIGAYSTKLDQLNNMPILQLQQFLHLLGDWPFSLKRLIEISIPETMFNTISVTLLEEERTMNKFVVIWDYTSLNINTQIKIVETLFRWHTSEKDGMSVWKHRGGAILRSHVKDQQIIDFVETNYLNGKIWFIKGKHPTTNWHYHVFKYGNCLVDTNMIIYTTEEMEIMLEKYKKISEGDYENE